MLDADEHLQAVLDEQKLGEVELSRLQAARGTVDEVLRQAFGSPSPDHRYTCGGSYGKHTMARASYDLDVVFYHRPTQAYPVQQVRSIAGQALAAAGLMPVSKDVAWRLQGTGFHVDVVPGIAVDNTMHDAYLYRSESGTRLRTSVEDHINNVRPRREVIKLMKLWRIRKNVDIKTFILEQAVVRAVQGTSLTDLVEQMETALEWLASDFVNARLIDPANEANVLSDMMSHEEKFSVALHAAMTLTQPWQYRLG